MKNKNKIKRSRFLHRLLIKHSGRDATGKRTVRHQGGRAKRFWRRVDFRRQQEFQPGKIIALEYDPNRTAEVAFVSYPNGQKKYLLAPAGMKIGEMMATGEEVEIETGNTLPLARIPVGTTLHNLELVAGKGAQIARSAGAAGWLMAKEGEVATVKLPSGETRRISVHCLATLGQVGRVDWQNKKIGSAGRQRRRGVRPTVRGVAQHPNSHPHGGGEGRSGIGLPGPKTPWGKAAQGKKTRRKKKASNKFIIKRRR